MDWKVLYDPVLQSTKGKDIIRRVNGMPIKGFPDCEPLVDPRLRPKAESEQNLLRRKPESAFIPLEYVVDANWEGKHPPGAIFITKLHVDVSSDMLVAYFSKYGEVDSVDVVKDPTTNKSLGMARLIYAAQSRSKAGAYEASLKAAKDENGQFVFGSTIECRIDAYGLFLFLFASLDRFI